MGAENTVAAAVVPGPVRGDGRRVGRVAWVLVVLAVAAWGWFGDLMLADWGPEVTGTSGRPELLCQGPLIEPSPGNNECHSEWREWPTLLGILALAVIASVAAAATTVYAMVLARLARMGGASGRSQG